MIPDLIHLKGAASRIRRSRVHRTEGVVTRVVGLTVESLGPSCAVGEECLLLDHAGKQISRAQVVGFADNKVFTMPLDNLEGVSIGSRVVALGRRPTVGVGPELLGRVLDSDGHPIDDGPPFEPSTWYPLEASAPLAMDRDRIRIPFITGVRALDGMITMGRGQRLGIFAGSGVGKSILLGMIARHARADVVVISLVGERGREVREFIEEDIGPNGMKHSVVFVATSDEPPLRRIRSAHAATAAAEYFRDQGKHVLLLMDSVTRVAMAQREVGLSLGEPPSSKGYPPSTFSLLPRLLERAGAVDGGGSITGIYSVYMEADDINDPISDAARSLLDGHLVLDRELAARGHYPAIDVLGSISRLQPHVAAEEHLDACRRLRARLAAFKDAEDLVLLGAYREGTSPDVDAAIRAKEPIRNFLTQARNDGASLTDTVGSLMKAVEAGNRGES